MPLQIYRPQAPLSHHINMFWTWDDYHPPHPKERILPFGMMELTINLADTPLCIYYPHAPYHRHIFYEPIVGGARSEFFIIDTAQPASLVSVWFKAGGAQAFFGVSGIELHNLHIPLSYLWGNDAHILHQQVADAKTTAMRFSVLEAYLLRRLTQANSRHPAVDFALSLLPKTQHISHITNQIALSPTRFIQVFKEEIGLTPKGFYQIQRFQRAIRIIAHSASPNWAEIALQCGYYDQAHFINAFQRFAGITPSAFMPQNPDHASNIPFWG